MAKKSAAVTPYRLEPVKRPSPVYWEFMVRDCRDGEMYGPYKTRDQAEAHIAEFEEDDAVFKGE
jgi:hypothetical protein